MTELARAESIAGIVLDCIHREYPYHLVHLARGDDDVRPPRELTPAFFGSFDWHSAVHSHWCLVRLMRVFPEGGFVARATAALAWGLTPEHIAGEHAYLTTDGRQGFERPYGLAWLLQLCAELREWDSAKAREWHAALAPLERLAVARFRDWLPRLPWPVRSGEHGQTAFALGLVHDWARGAEDAALVATIAERARAFYLADRDAPIAYEPSGHDFLSPALAEADLMRRVLAAPEFVRWLDSFLPDLIGAAAARWLVPVTTTDRADGKLSHLDGLNLSRAWMLEGVASALPTGDPRGAPLGAAARAHAAAGLAAVTGEHYAGAHWLGSFATYLITRRGIG